MFQRIAESGPINSLKNGGIGCDMQNLCCDWYKGIGGLLIQTGSGVKLAHD